MLTLSEATRYESQASWLCQSEEQVYLKMNEKLNLHAAWF
jgi:hypothetical protein